MHKPTIHRHTHTQHTKLASHGSYKHDLWAPLRPVWELALLLAGFVTVGNYSMSWSGVCPLNYTRGTKALSPFKTVRLNKLIFLKAQLSNVHKWEMLKVLAITVTGRQFFSQQKWKGGYKGTRAKPAISDYFWTSPSLTKVLLARVADFAGMLRTPSLSTAHASDECLSQNPASGSANTTSSGRFPELYFIS